MKTTVFNLVILDESGSMDCITKATISGCNEVLNTIRQSAQENSSTQRHITSIYAFQGGGPVKSRYIVKNAQPEALENITIQDYNPYGNTPMLDAVGSTLSELLAVASTHEDAVGVVTIITDGYENSSRSYTWQKVASLISQAKELGWTINIIGANIDVEKMAMSLNVDVENSMSFDQDEQGTADMFLKMSASMKMRNCEYACEAPMMSREERVEERKRRSKGFFKK